MHKCRVIYCVVTTPRPPGERSEILDVTVEGSSPRALITAAAIFPRVAGGGVSRG
jgi:hypothetical protein